MNEKGPIYALIPRDKKAYHTLDPDTLEELKTLFFMDGITSYAASQTLGIDPETARRYFQQWADELTEDPEHEKWAVRQKRVRARALEGIALKILALSKRKNVYEKILLNLLYFKDDRTDEPKLKSAGTMDHPVILNYETRILALDRHLAELQAEYDAIDAKPPAEIILRTEVAEILGEIKLSQL